MRGIPPGASRHVLAIVVVLAAAILHAQADDYLTWPATRADALAKGMYHKGRVGGFFDTRLLKTERSYNYKLAAIWLSPDVIRAAARLQQLSLQMSPEATRGLVAEAEAKAVGATIVMVEIDPREGSGVIPSEWVALLQPTFPDGRVGRSARGVNTPDLRTLPVLAGGVRRNYDYDRFWMVFALTHDDGQPVLPPDATGAELVVRIHDKEGRVAWPIPASIRHRRQVQP